ncbi:hypothetical protein ACROYT_G043688 [Oculina patagonica]
MERVKAESVSSTASSPNIPNLGKGDDNREHVIEGIPSENPVLIEETIQTDTTTRRNTKLKARKAQSTLKRKKEKTTKKKSLASLASLPPRNHILKNSIGYIDRDGSRKIKMRQAF